jgi:hypothetical protein
MVTMTGTRSKGIRILPDRRTPPGGGATEGGSEIVNAVQAVVIAREGRR